MIRNILLATLLNIVFTVETIADIHLNTIDVANKLGKKVSGNIKVSNINSIKDIKND